MPTDPGPDSDLVLVLEQSRDRGFLGPGPVVDHVDHAVGFATALGRGFEGQAVDLGSGGGVPGLVLARLLRRSSWLLVDASLRRVQFLQWAVATLGLGDRVEVRHLRAEELGREEGWRSSVDAVVARSFGPPAVVAECAAPLLRVGGLLAVSEPPRAEGVRWPVDGIRQVGLGLRGQVGGAGHRVIALELLEPCGPRFPRRAGVPDRSPLF